MNEDPPKKKKKKIWAMLIALASFGILEPHVDEKTQHRKATDNYIQTQYYEWGLKQRRDAFDQWSVVKENPDVKALVDKISNTNFEDKKSLAEFVPERIRLLQILNSVLNYNYTRGSPEYNEMLNKVIPEFVEYLKIELNLLPESFKETAEFREYKNMLGSK